MSELFGTAIVEKRNILNELRSNNMTLQELRFFSIYLSKINPYDVSTRVVRFPLNDFVRIMGIGTDVNIPHFRLTVRHILQQVVEVPNEGGVGYRAFQLFKEAVVERDDNNEWYVEFDAHDKALPLMFDFKNRYFKYELWNALRLKSSNQVRMYEILKQYETLGRRELTVKDLRSLLGVAPTEYAGRTGWSDFKKKVLDSCQEALKQTTDICFAYERGKVGPGGKWLTIIFHIEKNTEYVDQLTLDEFIELQPEVVIDTTAEEIQAESEVSDFVKLMSEACNNEFSYTEINELIEIMAVMTNFPLPPIPDLPGFKWDPITEAQMSRYYYLRQMYSRLNVEAEQRSIPRRFAYLRQMILNDE